MQKVIISGRLGRDAALRETQNGSKVISFTVAVNSRYRNVEKTSWYEVSVFNYERYKNMVQYLTKGSNVWVTGDFDADIDEGKDGITRCRRSVLADSVEFNGSGASGSTDSSTTKTTSEKQAPAPAAPEDEDMPRRSSKKAVKSEPAPDPDPNSDDLPF